MTSRSGKSTPTKSSQQPVGMQMKHEFKQEQRLRSMNFWSLSKRNVSLLTKKQSKHSWMLCPKQNVQQSLDFPMQETWITKQRSLVPRHLDYLQVLDIWNKKRILENPTSLTPNLSKNSMKHDLHKECFQTLQITTPTITEEGDTVAEAMDEDRGPLTGSNMGIFSPEDEVVEHSDPQRPINIPQTATSTMQQTSNKRNSVESHGLNQSENRKIIHYTNITNYHTTNNIITSNTGNHPIPNNNFNTIRPSTITSDADTSLINI